MTKINILSESLINKIAAGEVIERPASAVKELVENSLDSLADEVKIEIDDSGLRSIKITDNGEGMSEEDALLCFKRHATSKIRDEKDIFKIESLGFRGEALASIAEISSMNLTTKSEGEEGLRLEIEAGKLLTIKKAGAPKGTIIEINDLFFNVPARKKYLKSKQIEFQAILKVINRIALINKDRSFKLISDGREVFNSPKTDSLLNNIIFILGQDIGKAMVKVSYEEDGIKVEGYIAKPALTRANKSGQFLYINSRPISYDEINKGVYEGYDTLLFINRHPIYVLDVKVNSNNVDVNVHPAKEVVRLENEEKVREIVRKAVKEALSKSDLVVKANVEQETEGKAIKQYNFSTDRQQVLEIKEKQDVSEKKNKIDIDKPRLGPFAILGQVNKTFVVAESPVGLAIIDQHAVHERVNYEKFMKEIEGQKVKVQELVKAKVIELNSMQHDIAMSNEAVIENLGFRFSDFGNNSIKLTAVPELFGNLKSTVFIDVLEELSKGFDEEVRAKIIRKSCRASIKAGEELTIVQLKRLLEDLEKVDNPYSCPHGRPTIIELSVADLEKKFKRSGW